MRILFVHNALQSFVRADRDILASVHDVTELDLARKGRIVALPHCISRVNLVYVWFAGMHALSPVLGAALAGKPSVVVVGGYDTAREPDIGYGHMAHPWKQHVVRMICGCATQLVANSKAAADEVRGTTGTHTPVAQLYHGFVAAPNPVPIQKDRLAVTVGTVSHGNLSRKGLRVFARAAALLPDVRFVIAGRWADDAGQLLRADAAPNLEVRQFLSGTELDALLSGAAVYVQASRHEGFGSAVAEAMQRGCVPVISRRGALPEVAGDAGIFVDEDDAASVAAGIERALQAGPEDRIRCADRIDSLFPLSKRREALLNLVAGLGSAA